MLDHVKGGRGKAFFVAVFYFTCSISMNFLNKAVVSSYDFNYPFFIMSCQMVATVIFLDILRLLKISKLNPYSLKEGVDFLPASLSFALHSTLSLMALHGMNIPMVRKTQDLTTEVIVLYLQYGAIKRCTPLVNLILSVMILKKPFPSPLLTFSIALITVGVLVAGLGDLQFDGHAYTMGTLSVFAQVSSLALWLCLSEVVTLLYCRPGT